MPAARDPSQCASKYASGNIAPSETRMNASFTPSAATSCQLIVGWYLETSMPLIVGPTPHTNTSCSTVDTFSSDISLTAHPATTAQTKTLCFSCNCIAGFFPQHVG